MLKRFIPWHLTDDKTLLFCEGNLVPLCNVLRKMSAEHGIVDVQLLSHTLTPKLRPVSWLSPNPHSSPVTEAVEGEEPMPAPFRFAVGLQQGDKTPSFRPNNLDGQDLMNVKHQYLGQIFKANFNRIASTETTGLVWEVPCFVLIGLFRLVLGACGLKHNLVWGSP